MPKSLGKRPRSGKAKEPRGSTCPHGKVKGGYYCKECPGKGICEHGRRRSTCKECGGSSICEHGRVRSQCKECGGSQICEHGRRKYGCKECRAARVLCPPVHPKPEILVEPEDVEDPGEDDDERASR
jgi:hypothetical protein